MVSLISATVLGADIFRFSGSILPINETAEISAPIVIPAVPNGGPSGGAGINKIGSSNPVSNHNPAEKSKIINTQEGITETMEVNDTQEQPEEIIAKYSFPKKVVVESFWNRIWAWFMGLFSGWFV